MCVYVYIVSYFEKSHLKIVLLIISMLNVHPSYTKTFNCPVFPLLIILNNTLPNLHHTITITTSPLPQGKKKERERKGKKTGGNRVARKREKTPVVGAR